MNYRYSKAVHDHFIFEEGYRETAYLDHLGNYTIGIGHLLGRSSSFRGTTWTKEKIFKVFEDDLDTAVAHARNIFPHYDTLPPEVQLAIMDMIFNLGGAGFRKFKNFIRAINELRFEDAAEAALDSKWARQDVPNRARRTVELIRNAR